MDTGLGVVTMETAVGAIAALRTAVTTADPIAALLIGAGVAALASWLFGRAAGVLLAVALACLLIGYEAGRRDPGALAARRAAQVAVVLPPVPPAPRPR